MDGHMGEHIPDFDSARPHMQAIEHFDGERAAEGRTKLADALVWLEAKGWELPEDFRQFMERYRTPL